MKIKRNLILIAFTFASAVALADDDFGYTKKPDTSSSDTNFPVESFGGTFDVSSLGAATYTVPIDVPVGVGGMQPNLSITYNSQSSFGLLGLGFNLSGLSSITRGPKSVWLDGVSSGMTFDSDGALYLDGERLISEGNGEYSLASNRLVRVRKAKIEREVSDRSESNHTIVEFNNGKKTYKYYKDVYVLEVVSADETVSTYECLLPYTRNDKTCEYSWVLTSVVDKFGNTMTVDYLVDKQNWFVYPKTFTYGKNTVTFNYEGLSEESHRFSFADKIGCVNRRICSIVSKTRDDVYCCYELSYFYGGTGSWGTRTSLLNEIRKKNGDRESLRPLYLNWGKEHDFTIESAPIKNIKLYNDFNDFKWLDGNRKFLSADVNGDGITDILELDTFGEKKNGKNYYQMYLIVYASRKQDDGSIVYDTSKPFPLDATFDVEHKSAGYYEKMLSSFSVSFADFNNDGIQDLFIPFYGANEDGSYLYSYFLYGAKEMKNMDCVVRDYVDLKHAAEFKKTNFSDQLMNFFLPTGQKYDLPTSPLYATFDIDNDGIGNYLMLESVLTKGYGYKCYIGTPNDHGSFDKNVCFLNIPKAPSKLFVNDYNKDGMIDIMVLYDGGYSIFYNKGKELVFFSQNASVEGDSMCDHDIVREGDFDGDGVADYFYIDHFRGFWHPGSEHYEIHCEIPDFTGWYVAYGKGDGTFENEKIYQSEVFDRPGTDRDNGKFAVLIYDSDYDGRSDIFVSKAQYEEHTDATSIWGDNPTTHTYLYRSKGLRGENGFETVHGIHQQKKCGQHEYDSYWMVGDFNGEGRNGLVHYCAVENVWFDEVPTSACSFVSHKFKVGKDYRKLKGIIDAMDNTIEINYEPLATSNVYSEGNGTEFPVIEQALPMDVVASVTRSNGVLPSSRVEYQYKGLKFHSQGRGVLGFDEITYENKVQRLDGSYAPKSKVVSCVDSYDSQFYTPAKTIVETYVWRTGKNDYELYNSSSIEYQTEAVGDKGNYFHHPVRKAVTDLYGHTSYIDYEYDAQNYVLKSEDAYSDDGEGGMDKAVVYLYPTVKDKNYKGALKPCEIQTAQKHADDKNMFCVKTKLEYDENGLLVKKIDNYGTDKALTTLMDYDYVGNLSETKILGSDVKTKIVSNVYDKSHRFLILTYTEYEETPNTATLHKYDKWGHCTYTANFDNFIPDDYDENAAEEDIVGATSFVRNEYDSWGNLVRSVDTFNNVKTVTKGWGDSQDKKYYILTQGTHTPWVKTWYDSMGREVETESVGAKDIALSTKTTYDELGNVVKRESQVGDRKVTETITYDDYSRVIKTESTTGEITTTVYDDRSVTVTAGNKTVTKVLDSWGNPKSVDDGECEVTYTYNSNGKPSKVVAGDDVTTFEYDEVGNKTSMKTSDRGTITYKYNSLGECVYTKEGSRVYQTTGFDEQGRVTEKKVGAYVVKYVYGTDDEDANKLVEKALYDPSNKLVSKTSYYYDEYGRVEQEEKYIAKTGNSYWTDYTYNQFGELNSVNGTTYEYDCYGNKVDVLSVSQRQTGPGIYEDVKKTLWHMSKNKGKSCEATLFGDGGLKSEYTYDDAGRLTNSLVSYRGSSICSLGYEYDNRTGNLKSRSGMIGNKETFYYDDLDRLTIYRSLDGQTRSMDYSDNGNITEKSDLGTYVYDHSSKPHRLTALDNEDGVCPLDTREISYNAWNRVSKIKDAASGYELQFEYDEDGNRIWSKLTKNGVWLREIEYAGNVEHIMTNTSDDYFTYLGDNLVCYDNDFSSEILYLCTDHLGSIVKIVDEHGNARFEAKYDAWGNQEVVRNDIGFIRGYTGHEEMPEFGLVNMNARLYDPMLGRFLSPDDFVQMPENSQNFNRYAYCLNNPLKYSDPSGNFIQWPLVAFAAWQAGMTSWANGDSFMSGAAQGAAVSIVSQGFAYGIGSAFGHQVGSVWNEALRAGAHGLSQGALGVAEGGDFWTCFAAGAISSIAGSGAGAIWNDPSQFDPSRIIAICTLTGGLATLITDDSGNSFFQGAMIGFNVGCLNHCGERQTIEFGEDDESIFDYLVRKYQETNWYSDSETWFSNAGKVKKMFDEFVSGTGPKRRAFVNDKVAKAFRNSCGVNKARDAFYKQCLGLQDLSGRTYHDHYDFGIKGLVKAGIDPVEQFVGSYDVDIIAVDKSTLRFKITNTTSFWSLMYHVAPSWERSQCPRFGNTYQKYIFTEPIRAH